MPDRCRAGGGGVSRWIPQEALASTLSARLWKVSELGPIELKPVLVTVVGVEPDLHSPSAPAAPLRDDPHPAPGAVGEEHLLDHIADQAHILQAVRGAPGREGGLSPRSRTAWHLVPPACGNWFPLIPAVAAASDQAAP